MKLITSVLIAGFLAGSPCMVRAANPEAVTAPAIHEQATVNVVNIDAFVTNAAGEPITDLQARDFELFENGKPVAISNFFASGAALGETSGTTPGDPAAATGPDGQQLLFVLFVDGLNMTPNQRKAVFSRSEAIIGEVLADPATRIMVVSGGLTVAIRQPFTRDPLLVLRALKTMEGESGAGAAAFTREAMMRTQIETAPEASAAGASEFGSLDRESILQTVRSAAQQEYEQTRAAIQSATAFVGSLGGLPGRKALLYVGGGIRVRPGEALLQRAESKFGGFSAATEASRYDLTRFVRELAARANAHGVTIYCVDAGGNRVLAGVDATDRFIDSDRGIEVAATLSSQGAFQYLAKATG
ncbi:MAG: VWA domain-containing protein, partial [Acidobacteria bacterium]|nr:VWA domain-containing protein [Acidobacteriota bacterium]